MPIGWVAGASLAGSLISGSAAESAAGDQEAAANAATALQSQIYNQTVTRNQPFVTAGTAATNQLSTDLGLSGQGTAGYNSLNGNFTAADYLANQDPGYQFQLQTGENAISSMNATTGSAIGGAALKGLNNFAQNTASTGYQNAFNRYQTQQGNVFDRLSSLAGIGQASANNTAASGNAFGATAGSNIIGAGNAAAAGTVGAANAASSGLTNAAGYYYMNGLNGSSSTPSTLISSQYSGSGDTSGGTDFISG